MGLFSFGKKTNEGGLMDAIRCDEKAAGECFTGR